MHEAPVEYGDQELEGDGYITVVPAFPAPQCPATQSPEPPLQPRIRVGTSLYTMENSGRVVLVLTGAEGTMCSILDPHEARMLARHLTEQAEAIERECAVEVPEQAAPAKQIAGGRV